MNPEITVLMSVYNGEKYLRESIESILNQTYKNFEFLIINDASTDSSRDIILSYNDPRIRLVDNEQNIGLTRSLNKGLKLAMGEYIARMDADDISMPERFEKEIEFFENHPNHAVVGTFVKVIDEKSDVILSLKKYVHDAQIRDYLKIDTHIAHGSAMIRKKCILDVGFYNESMIRSQDYDLWLRLSEKFMLANIPEYLYMWRKHNNNFGAKFRTEQLKYVELAKKEALERKIDNFLIAIKNDTMDVEHTTKLIINLITDKNLPLISMPLKMIFSLISLITLNKIGLYRFYKVIVKFRFSRKINSILRNYQLGILSFKKTKSCLKNIIEH